MPRQQPFTQTCQSLANLPRPDRADLHLHTVHSDGEHTPEEVVSLATRSGLAAISVTDHDTLSGIEPTRLAAQDQSLQIIPGVEISTEHQNKELHLLAYFFDEEHEELNEMLLKIRTSRVARFLAMIERLQSVGVPWRIEKNGPQSRVVSSRAESPLPPPESDRFLGRRAMADLLVEHGAVSTVREAFKRFLGDHAAAHVPKKLIPVVEAIEVVHQAGGVTSWAHPSARIEKADLLRLREQNLDAVEVTHPSIRPTRSRQLRQWADELSLVVSGGSDSHGSHAGQSTIGAKSISLEDLDRLEKKRPIKDPDSE